MIQRNLLKLLVFASLILLCGSVFAQVKQGSVGILPASIDAKVKSGGSYTQNFTLTNNTSTRLRFSCSTIDYWYDEQNKRITGRPGTLPRTASLWVQFTPAEVVVEPNSTATVKAVVTVPQGVSGSFYTMPVFEAMPADKSANSNLQASTATAAIGVRFRGLMMFTTEGTSEYNVEVINGRITPPTASSELNMHLELLNRGTAHAGVRGAFAILNTAGALVGRGSVQEKRFYPRQRNTLQSAWAGELPPGNYTCIVTLSYDRVGMNAASLVYELPFTVK